MIDLNIIDRIDMTEDKSEIDVLMSICESYHKMITVLSESEHPEIVQENFIFMESDKKENEDNKNDSKEEKTSNKKSFKEFFLSLINKILEAVRGLVTKVIDFLRNKILRNKDKYYRVINSLMIIEAFEHISVKSFVQESGFCDVEYDDVYMEENYSFIDDYIITENYSYRRAQKRIEKAKKEQEKQHAKEVNAEFKSMETVNLSYSEIEKGLKSYYRTEIGHHILTRTEVKELVISLAKSTTPESIEEIRKVIKDFYKTDVYNAMSQEAKMQVDAIKNHVAAKNNAKYAEIREKILSSSDDRVAAEKNLDIFGSWVENVSGSLSGYIGLNGAKSKAAYLDTFKTTAVHGGAMLIHDLLASIVHIVFKLPSVLEELKQAVGAYTISQPLKIAKKIGQDYVEGVKNIGANVGSGVKQYQQDYHNIDDELKRMGKKTDTIMKTVKFVTDGAGEETVICQQDRVNSEVYQWVNPIKHPIQAAKKLALHLYSGPCTCVMRILSIFYPSYITFATLLGAGYDVKEAVKETAIVTGVVAAKEAVKKIPQYFTHAGIHKVFTTIMSKAPSALMNTLKDASTTAAMGAHARLLTGDMTEETPTQRHERTGSATPTTPTSTTSTTTTSTTTNNANSTT